ncbi:hypothetical protein D9M69_614530 [compost metagenome]
MFGEVYRPLADSPFPHAGVQLAARAVVVVVHRLLGITLQYFGRIRAIAFGGGGGLAEVDDILDAHCCIPPSLRCEWWVSGQTGHGYRQSLCLLK